MLLPAELLKYAVVLPAKATVLLTCLGLVLGRRLPSQIGWAVAGFGWLAFALLTIPVGPDFTDGKCFWEAGQALRQGSDPYTDVLNLPTAFPLFWLLGGLSYESAIVVWTGLNMMLAMVLPFVAHQALGNSGSRLALPELAVVSAALCLSAATFYGIDIGQMGLFIAATLLLTVWAARHAPILAGAGLAVASAKVTTMLPFLLLFQRRRDLAVWIVMVAVGFALCVLIVPIGDLPGYVADCWHSIGYKGQAGKINDHTHAFNFDLITLERGIYYLGMTERSVIRSFGLVIQALLALLLLFRIRRGLPFAASASLTACFAALFLYHRIYDMPILVLPLVYAIGQARETRGWVRALYLTAALAVLGNWYQPVDLMLALAREPLAGSAGAIINALVVPQSIWLALLALVSLLAVEHARQQERERAGAAVDPGSLLQAFGVWKKSPTRQRKPGSTSSPVTSSFSPSSVTEPSAR